MEATNHSNHRQSWWGRSRWARVLTRQLPYIADALVLAAAFWLGYLFRFDFHIPEEFIKAALAQLPLVVLWQIGALSFYGAYRLIWRYVGLADARIFLQAAVTSSLPILLLRLTLPERFQWWRMPLSVWAVDVCLGFGGVMLLRLLRRTIYEHYEDKLLPSHQLYEKRKANVLLIGAGRAGALAAREIQSRSAVALKVVGFLDDDADKLHASIHGVKVLGTTQDLPRLVAALDIDHVIITIAQASREEIRRIVEICEAIPLKVRIIPGFHDVVQGKVQVSNIRDVQIEDLLGREPVHLDETERKRLLSGKTVMVTGAGGSIGSELARQVAQFRPSHLLLVERAEFALFNIDRELKEAWPHLQITPLVADVGDETRMRAIFAAHHPQVILHAAAHKHVPMMETNPAEAIKNNILATKLVGELAGEFATEVFVMISTDKAVRPTSMMGASKRVAELVIQDLDRKWDTRYVAVRFGNVIGSAGSVLNIFSEQIRKGGPVTITHPEMVRYFMTIPEASQLVLEASAIGKGGEIFILDMGEPVKILELAKDMITLSGLRPYEDIDIKVTGIRPGEKLFEELSFSDEAMAKTRHPKIYIGKLAAYAPEKVSQALQDLQKLATTEGKEKELRRFLNAFLPEAKVIEDENVLAEAIKHIAPETEEIEPPPGVTNLSTSPA
jgi:FlaA1/EpsC-like NDP-sugar epimerase